MSKHSKLQPEQTDRQTDRQTDITFSHIRALKLMARYFQDYRLQGIL